MKKVFAFLSTLLLTIAFVGIFAVSNPAVAANKITEDPTLAEDEIPVYIMNSIYTTFPNYYDNDAVADANWPGPARMYPWNETRLRVAQLDENGKPTGDYYAVYFAGHTQAKEGDELVVGAGKNILFWDYERDEAGQIKRDEAGNATVVAKKMSDGKYTSSGGASDPSLSHMRTNISGEAISVDPTTLGLGDEGTNFYNRSIVFDAEGRIVRAVGLDTIYSKTAVDQVMAPEYCYVDGVVTKMDDNTVCDKLMIAEKDENGDPVLGDDGLPVMVPSDEDNILYSRFVYEYFDEKPENVNTVPYLSQGWDAMRWDYVYPEGDGWLAIAFVGSANGTQHKLVTDQVTAYAATLKARYIEEGMEEEAAEEKASTDAADAVRDCTKEYRIPAGGWTFDYGYLDKGTGNDVFFNDTVIKGYKYGRKQVAEEVTKDAEGNEVKKAIYMGAQRTYNFSVTGLYFREKVIDDSSYQLLKGQNVVEVMQGTTYKAAQNIVYDGVMRYWETPGDLTSYKADATPLEFYITESVNGGSASQVVAPPSGILSQDELLTEFVKDFNAYLAERDGYKLDEETGKYMKDGVEYVDKLVKPSVDWTDAEIHAKWYSVLDWNLAGTGGTETDPETGKLKPHAFVNIDKWYNKWAWVFKYLADNATSNNANLAISGDEAGKRYVGSPGSLRIALYGFFTESPQRSVANTWANTCADWTNGKATGWIDATPSKDKWNAYEIDASMAAPNDNWVVTYKVLNSATGVDSELTIKYVVVDSYTPILKVDANKLVYIPKVVADLVVCDPIDIYEIVEAYDAQYNGVNILGNDISQNIEIDTELNFAEPKEGIWPVVATIYNNAGTKKAVAKFNIEIKDITAPNAETRKVVIQAGDDFDCRAGIVLAVDAVDGDLTQLGYTWWEETSKPVDTTKVTQDSTYTVKVRIYDIAGNYRDISYTLVVVADKFNKNVTDQIADIASKVDTLTDSVTDIVDAQDDLTAKVEGLEGAVAELGESLQANAEKLENINTVVEDLEAEVDNVSGAVASKCGNGTALVLQIAGAAALLALVLRKKH